MLKNSAISFTASKLANSSLVSGSLFLVGGIVIWKLWSRQEQLQAEIKKLGLQMKNVKRQVKEIGETHQDKTDEAATSVFKKFFHR